MGEFCPSLDIEYRQRGICDRLTEYGLGIGLESSLDLFIRRVRRNESKIDAHFPHGYIEEVVGSSVDRGSGNDIRKVGAGNLTLTANRVRNVFLKDGVVTLAHGTNSVHQETRYTFEGGTMAITGKCDDGEKVDFCDPSALIVDSASPICFSNAVGEVHTWATALDVSNTGGLGKRGEGTLTLEVLPSYTGKTYLDGGVLRVPLTWRRKVRTHVAGKHTESTVEGDYRKYTIVDGPAPLPTMMMFR